MQTLTEILIWAVGLVTIAFFIAIIIAVLKISSESDDDLERMIDQQAKKGLKDREERKTGGDSE